VPTSALYRRVWRWHFYAGLVCLPFLLLLAVTGALYLFKDPIESLVYARLRSVEPVASQALDAEALVARALQATPGGEPVRFIAAERGGRSAEVGLRTADGTVAVYLDPSTGRVLGSLADDTRLMEVVKGLHSLTLAGPVANHWIEIVAGWAIVLVVTGVFLWWPRGGGAYRIRGRPPERTWWRDLHAVTGATAAVAVLFLAVTGMPWSAFWGQQFGRLTSEWGLGAPQYVWGKPQSAKPLASLGEVPWALGQVPVPSSDPHAHHGAAVVAPPPAPATKPLKERAFGLNGALRTFEQLGMPPGTPVALPAGPTGVYSALRLDDEVQAERVVHLDRYSGAVLADVGYRDYGAAARATAWGISLHTGRQFGWMNQLVMLAACLSIVTLAVSSAVMWWKRRPRGRLAAPPRREADRAALAAVMVAVLLGVLYPLLGASMLVALALDLAVPRRWHERFGL
jgi:uncharacterized iron-regulated membrane protein